MEKERGRTTTGLYRCLCSAQLPGAKIEGWRVLGWFLRVILVLLWVGERPVHVWGVLSSEILVPNQTKQTKTSLCFCRRISQGYQEMEMDTKSHPPKKKIQTVYISMYILGYLSIEGTLQEHCAVLISKSLPACVSYTFCIAVLFVLGEKIRLHLVKLK